DEPGIELGHHPLEPAEEHALSARGLVAAHDLQFGQPPLAHQRHQEGLGQHMADQAIDRAHACSDFTRATVSTSGSPTTLMCEPEMEATQRTASTWVTAPPHAPSS